MNKFKYGDTVVCIKKPSWGGELRLNKKYKVEACTYNEIFVRLNSSEVRWMNIYYFATIDEFLPIKRNRIIDNILK